MLQMNSHVVWRERVMSKCLVPVQRSVLRRAIMAAGVSGRTDVPAATALAESDVRPVRPSYCCCC